MDPGTTMVLGFGMSLTFAAVIAIVRSVTRVSLTRYRAVADGNSGSMTASELRKMITEAVSDATDPLYERMGRLERKVDALQGESSAGESFTRPEIEIPAADEYEPLQEIATRRRSRV